MSYEDRLRAMLQHAGEALPDGPRVDRETTIRKARRDHRVNMAAAGLATAAAIAIGAVATSSLLGGSELRPLPPRTTPSHAPSPSPTPTPSPTVSCSATRLSSEPSEQDLPPAVADLRARIVEAAVRCDYRTLARLAKGGEGFTHSYGDSADPAPYWNKLESVDIAEEPMAMLVGTLDLPHCVEATVSAGVTLYAWPAAQCSSSTEQDYEALRESGLYTEEEIRQFEQRGAFLGWRIGITEEGDWLYFTAGD